MSVKDLDALLSLLEEKKRNLVKAEAETNKHLLLDFLHCLRKKKVEELKEVCNVGFRYCSLANGSSFSRLMIGSIRYQTSVLSTRLDARIT